MSGLHVVRGADPALRAQARQSLVDRLLEGEDRTLVVEEHAAGSGTGGDEDQALVDAVVNALASPPFMTTRRIVVLRDYDQLAADEAKRLAAGLAERFEANVLVLEGEKASRTKTLEDALKDAEVVSTATGRTGDVLGDALADHDLHLDTAARELVVRHLGEDAGRVGGLVSLLLSTFGQGAALGASDVEPYLGEVGSVRSFELTNRIEAGDVPGAVDVLNRLLSAPEVGEQKPMHPLQVMGLLHARYRRLARLDDPAITTVDDAHAALGGRKGSTFGSRKALEASRALGTDGIRRAFDHLHTADLALKGANAMPEDAVMAVLVARLAALSGRGSGAPRRRAAAR